MAPSNKQDKFFSHTSFPRRATFKPVSLYGCDVEEPNVKYFDYQPGLFLAFRTYTCTSQIFRVSFHFMYTERICSLVTTNFLQLSLS